MLKCKRILLNTYPWTQWFTSQINIQSQCRASTLTVKTLLFKGISMPESMEMSSCLTVLYHQLRCLDRTSLRNVKENKTKISCKFWYTLWVLIKIPYQSEFFYIHCYLIACFALYVFCNKSNSHRLWFRQRTSK